MSEDRSPRVAATPYPAMGCNTTRRSKGPFSLRLPKDLMDGATERAAANNVSLGRYIRNLVEADLTGKPARVRRGKYDDLRRDLGRLHAEIIRVGNQIAQAGHGGDQEEPIGLLKDAVAALLRLAHGGADE